MGRNLQKDKLTKTIVHVIKESDAPLETRELEEKMQQMVGDEATRTKLLYRLMDLRGEGIIYGKTVGSGRGAWIWWNPSFTQIKLTVD
jgi:repressor of nif and glnA expression